MNVENDAFLSEKYFYRYYLTEYFILRSWIDYEHYYDC